MIDEAMEILDCQIGIMTAKADWGQESVTAGREELDPDIITANALSLPELVMTHLFIYVEPDTQADYVVFFVEDIVGNKEFVRGLLKEGKLIWSEVE